TLILAVPPGAAPALPNKALAARGVPDLKAATARGFSRRTPSTIFASRAPSLPSAIPPFPTTPPRPVAPPRASPLPPTPPPPLVVDGAIDHHADQLGQAGGVQGRLGADDPVGSLLGGSACRDRGLEQVGRRWLLGQLVGVITRDLVLQLQARAAGGRQLRQRC